MILKGNFTEICRFSHHSVRLRNGTDNILYNNIRSIVRFLNHSYIWSFVFWKPRLYFDEGQNKGCFFFLQLRVLWYVDVFF